MSKAPSTKIDKVAHHLVTKKKITTTTRRNQIPSTRQLEL